MTRTDNLARFISSLVNRTRADHLVWTVTENGFELELANGTLIQVWGMPLESPVVYNLTVHSPGVDFPVAMASSRVGTPDIPELQVLFELVRDGLGGQVLVEAQALLDSNAQILPAPTTTTTPAPRVFIPSPPSSDEESAIFSALTGKWHLNYGRGT
ncbi:MAG: hypothetical protein ACRC7O_10190, partial [Fimbriiglobus sp.]